MKAIILFACTFFSLFVYAQNVGINKPNPAYPLDVNGNANVSGNILVNNTAGTAGQVLRTTTSGATAWANMSDYTYMVNFTQSGSFTVPAGVTKIMIEAWGGGGGGSIGGGGGAGMYIMSVQNVNAGESISLTIGAGGTHATVDPGAASVGGTTIFTGSFGTYTVAPGLGATATTPGYATHYGTTGSRTVQYVGQAGDANTFTYAQKNTSTFAIIRKYGDGGAAGPNYSIRSQGETRSFNESTGALIESNNPTFAPFPAGGGGGGALGEDGAGGMVIIRY